MCEYFLTVPTAPRQLMVVNVTISTVSLSWMEPNTTNGIITHYQVQYKKNDSDAFTSLKISKDNLTYTVTGLTSNTKYMFRVRAFTVVGNGPPTDPDVDYYTGKYHNSVFV